MAYSQIILFFVFLVSVNFRAALKFGFLFCTGQYFIPFHFLLSQKAWISSSWKYCSRLWDLVLSIVPIVLDQVQWKAVWLTNIPRSTFISASNLLSTGPERHKGPKERPELFWWYAQNRLRSLDFYLHMCFPAACSTIRRRITFISPAGKSIIIWVSHYKQSAAHNTNETYLSLSKCFMISFWSLYLDGFQGNHFSG